MTVVSDIAVRGKVLVVEDDESSAVFVTRVLERAGFQSAWALDAEQATGMLVSSAFDVLLTDFRLPGRSGLELAREARDLLPGIGIAMMTSFNEGDLERTALSSGVDEFFEKPLRPAAFISRISALAIKARPLGLGGTRSVASSDSPPAPGAIGVPGDAAPGVPSGAPREGGPHFGTPGLPPTEPLVPGCEGARDIEGASGSLRAGEALASAVEIVQAGSPLFGDASRGPIFRRLGRPTVTVPLWASAAPTVSHVASGTGPVSSPRTRPASTYSR
ncbi:MAG: response regulator transcription factor [Acidimicrobiales bacterium]